MSKLIKFSEEKDNDNIVNLIPVHINKMRCENYFWHWSSNHGDWIRTEKISEELNKIKNLGQVLNEYVDRSKYVEYISQKNNKSYSEVEKVFNDVEFISLYRSEGVVVDRENLPLSVRGNSGRWFTPNYKEMVRYNNMNKNRVMYKIDVPLDFYNAMRKAFGTQAETSKGEIKLPIELALLKTKM